MRRNDREITDRQVIAAFLSAEQILRVAFYDDGDIYIVPVNYGWCEENGRICFYFHGAKAGRKYTLAQQTPKVGFEMTADMSCSLRRPAADIPRNTGASSAPAHCIS